MKFTIKAVAIGFLALLSVPALNAAASATTEDRFPLIPGAPSWYLSAPGAPYASSDTTSADQLSVQEENEWHAAAWWYSPDGGAPSASDPDIIVETFLREDWEVGATDPNLITLSLNAAFPALTDSLGTEFNTGVAVPNDNSGAAPTLILPGDGIIIAQRPARDCLVTNDLKDSSRFTINLAMLGANQSKYLVNLTIEYGKRTWNEACASAVSVAPVEEKRAPKAEKAEKVDEIKKGAEVVESEEDTVAEGAPVVESVGLSVWVFGGVVVFLLLVLGWTVFGRRKKTHNNDGTPITPENAVMARSSSSSASVGARHEGRW